MAECTAVSRRREEVELVQKNAVAALKSFILSRSHLFIYLFIYFYFACFYFSNFSSTDFNKTRQILPRQIGYNKFS